ncbi:hypothetical protein O163_14455 [Caldanaerobacter subterraneus subsp. yonseiensis KB-1]|uniref:Uncharacterized protein n=1 Tax=Caldanaerobacter subterraneus subsp. yonseiensis KB-1 TaxID=1388761 RepID=U5CCR0_CALSX|nr:hypothetical protein O163_14455 [Caldanaerobacter subterraneus subsp. yonseiensis KB-1]
MKMDHFNLLFDTDIDEPHSYITIGILKILFLQMFFLRERRRQQPIKKR